MSLLGHWQLGFDCGVGCSVLNRHCRCHWYYMIIVAVRWEGTVVIETCFGDVHSFIVSVSGRGFIGVGLGFEDAVSGSHRWAVEWSI